MKQSRDQAIPLAQGRRRFLANVAVRKALRLSRQGNAEAAIAVTSQMIRLEPRCSWAYFYRGGLRLAMGELEGAVSDFTTMEPINPNWMLICRDLQVPPPACYPGLRENMSKMLRLEPYLPWGHVFKAFFFRILESWDESISAINHSIKLAPKNPAIWAFSARLKYIYRLPEEGIRAMEKAWKLAPDCPWICAWLGEVSRYTRDYQRAHELLDKAIALDPIYNIAYSWRGSVLRCLGRSQEALKDINHAMATELVGDYSLAWAYHERSLLKRTLKDYLGAIKDLNLAHRVNLRYVWAGDRYRKSGSDIQSLELLDHIVSLHPRCAWAYAWRGFTLGALGRVAEAADDINRALRLNPKLARAYVWRACLLMGETEKALRDLRLSVRLDPNYALAHLLKGKIESGRGRWETAEGDFEKAVKVDRVCAAAWAERGHVAIKRKKHAEAEQYLAHALRLDPNFNDALQWQRELSREKIRS